MELVLIFSFSTELVLLVFRLVLRRREWDGVVHWTVMLFYPPVNSTSLPCAEPADVGWVIFLSICNTSIHITLKYFLNKSGTISVMAMP